jgi:hypothetical protein
MDMAPQLMARMDSRLAGMAPTALKALGRDEEVEKASIRNLSARRTDAVKAIRGQNICESASFGEQYIVSMFLTNLGVTLGIGIN